MQVTEMPQPRPLSISRRNLVSGDGSYEGNSSTYIGDVKSSPPGATVDIEEKTNTRRSNPHRRFSKKWFDHAWDQAVEIGRWPRVTYAVIGFVLVVAWIGVMLTFAREEVKAQRKNLDPNGGKSQLDSGPITYQFDPIERSLRVSWGLVYVGDDNRTVQATGQTVNDTWEWNLYRDVKAVPEDREANATILQQYNITQEQLQSIIYRVDNTTQPPIATLGMHPWDGVDTDIDFTQAKEEDPFAQPLFAYPFDGKGRLYSLLQTDGSQGQSILPTLGLHLYGAILSDSTLNWRIQVSANDTCRIEAEDAGCELHLDFTGRRPGLVKFAAILAVLVNWTSTIGIFLLTCESVVMRRTYILTETDILGVCVGALFALPSVRAILPGAPDFGAIIDLIGIIPNIIIVSLCTTAIALSKLTMRRPKNE
ncbi:SubName: Full=Uncharacterized protein {ECO:0000313/EMBL:CCA74901.1} [Serendipita indica DSM 11827]|nr:SubName: Full=Uncharacterized protein {ECO:0000313/EMBL:CCA74901.1} [Serendipita indica DSM 11827]